MGFRTQKNLKKVMIKIFQNFEDYLTKTLSLKFKSHSIQNILLLFDCEASFLEQISFVSKILTMFE
jgi:hypothetical protein